MALVKAAWALVLLAAGCAREAAGDPRKDPVPAPAATAVPSTSATQPPPSLASPPSAVPLPIAPAPAAAADEPLLMRTDAGLVPAARATRILHVGDSMVPLVGNYLRPVLQARGHTYDIVALTSSSTLEWGGPKRVLQDAMYRYDPEVVLISLGSNELFDTKFEERAPAVRQIVEDTRRRPCLWIGPPAWKKDYGFMEMVKKNLGHCRWFDSTALRLPRMKDGRHPTWGGSYRWASEVWKALGGTELVPTGDVSTQ
jgi:hypothetical protein